MTFNALKSVILPCVIAGKNAFIKTDEVKATILLLLSKSSMKRAEIVIDLKHDKKALNIMSAIFTNWITLLGASKKFLSDHGGEFNNDEMRALADSYGIRLMRTAAESPWYV